MSDQPFQREVFLNGEADAWFERNRVAAGSGPVSVVDARIAAHLEGASSILEVGCADGRRLATLASLRPELSRIAGVDPSAAAITDGHANWPHIDLRVGSADELPFDEQFDVVVLGFFLYLCDRSLLPRIVAEVDRVLADGGALAIIDFDPPNPRRRRYRHHDGVWSFKMDYSVPFLAFPSYVQVEKHSFSHTSDGWVADETERVALHVLRKQLDGGYADEDDSAS
jgi:SAM-dependent methyltransferase